MCMVSVLTQAVPNQIPGTNAYPPFNSNPFHQWTLPQATEFKQILDRLDALDKSLGLRDCKDDAKDQTIRYLLKRIEQLESE